MITDEFKNAYQKLNTEQKKAVDTIEGPVMVIAGPGTGKTTMLTLRIANILKKTDTNPENILALTFTNSGVHAIRKKLIEYMKDDAYRVNIFTFHSFAENIIKEFGFYFKNLEFTRVITDLEKIEILEKILEHNKFQAIISKNDVFSSLDKIRSAIDNIKQEGLSPEDFTKRIPEWEQELLSDESIFYKVRRGKFNVGDIKPTEKEKIDKKILNAKEVGIVFKLYQQALQEKGLYDFSDMIINVLAELEINENLKLDLQEHYQYLLVDEHQDTNNGQNRLIEFLTDAEHLNGKPNLFTVGDEKQSIYRFQGASEKTFMHFNEIYNDIEIIDLKDNYRSTRNVLESSHALILNSMSQATSLKSHRQENEKIELLEFSNYKFELLFLAEQIQNKISAGVDVNDIAVIYKKNKHVEDLKEIFSQKNIPINILSKEFLLEDIHINNLVSLLRVVYNPRDNHNLGKSLLINFLNFDSYEVLSVLNEFNSTRSNDKILFEFISEKDCFKDFTQKIKKLKTDSVNSTFGSFFKNFLEEIGYLEFMLSSSDSRYQLLKVDKLFDEIKKQIASKKNYSLDDFIKFIDAHQKYNLDIETHDSEAVDGVKLMTAHKSKGLEFDYVYIINATRKSWEKGKGFGKIALPVDDYKGDIDDERRLFYVAMTRAKKGLCITSSLTDWEGREQDRTQFIAELGNDQTVTIDTKDFEKKNIDKLSLFFKSTGEDKNLFNSEYLKKIFLEKNLSVTSLNNYLTCPIKYLFRNLIQLPSDYSPNLMFGDIVHNALEKFFNESNRLEKIQNKKLLLIYFNELIKQSSFYGTEYDRYQERGRESLSEYYDYYHKTWITDIENEKYIKRDFQLQNQQVISLSGRLDKVEFLDSKLGGNINIIDYKTGKPFSEKSSKSDKEGLDRQLVFYHILYENYADNKFTINKAMLDFIEKNKKGDFEQHVINVTSESIEKVKDDIRTMSEEVLSGEFLNKGCEKKDCEYCKLYKRCVTATR